MARVTATLREQAFVEHLTTPGDPAFGNATEAVIAAGYRPRNRAHAARMAYALKFRPAVESLLAVRRKAVREDMGELALRVVDEMYAMALFDPKDLVDAAGNPLSLEKMPERARRALASVEIEFVERVIHADDGDRVMRVPVVAKYRAHDKKAAGEVCLRWAGELKDKLEVSGGVTLEQLVPKNKPQSTEGSK